MKILIDENDNLISAKKQFQPETILENIESVLHSTGRVIKTIKFNNKEIEAEDLQKKFVEKAPEASDVLSIETSDLKDHLSVLLDAIGRGLDDAEEQAVEIADKYMDVNNQESLKNLNEWCGNIGDLLENILGMISVFNVDVNGLSMGEKDFSSALGDIQEYLQNVHDAMEKDDDTRVSDLMEFELSGSVRDLKDILPALKKRMIEVLDAS